MHNHMHMRTTLNLDDDLIREAGRLTGLRVKTDLIHEGLRALISQHAARRLAAFGGKLRAAKAPPRRRSRESR